MTLPISPLAISFSQIQTEFGGTNPISLSEYYAGGAQVPAGTGTIPASGMIKISQFAGTSNNTAFAAYLVKSTTSGTAPAATGLAALGNNLHSVVVEIWAGGGGGSVSHGGGGGGYLYFQIPGAYYKANVAGQATYTIGTGGSGGSVAQAGNNTVFTLASGSFKTAQAGGPGAGSGGSGGGNITAGDWSFLLSSNSSIGGRGGTLVSGVSQAGGSVNFAGGGGGSSGLGNYVSGGVSQGASTYSHAVLTADGAGGNGGNGQYNSASFAFLPNGFVRGGGGGASASRFTGAGGTGAIRFAFIPVTPA